MTNLEQIIIAISGINYSANNLHQVAFLLSKSDSEILKESSNEIQAALKACGESLTKSLQDLVELMNSKDILCEETIAILQPIIDQLENTEKGGES